MFFGVLGDWVVEVNVFDVVVVVCVVYVGDDDVVEWMFFGVVVG